MLKLLLSLVLALAMLDLVFLAALRSIAQHCAATTTPVSASQQFGQLHRDTTQGSPEQDISEKRRKKR